MAAYFISKYVRNENFIANILQAARENLFPGNEQMGPPRIYPDDVEQKAILLEAKVKILNITPEKLKPILFGVNPAESVDDLLSLFGNKYVNKHLIYTLLDHLVLTAIPELSSETPQAIWLRRRGDR